jgi:GNAT superfamily N-acetyltransferase
VNKVIEPRGSAPTYLEHFTLDEVSGETLDELTIPFTQAYHNGHMHQDLVEDLKQRPEPFQLFIARLTGSTNTLAGVSVVESKPHDFIDYLGFEPVHVKRFTVLPEFRRMGIGKQLLDASKRYCLDELGFPAMFGESNEVGALSLYGREGALYQVDSIKNTLRRTTAEQNVGFFVMFVTDPAFRDFRYPIGAGIQFVYPQDEETAEFFRAHGYASAEELLDRQEKA